MRLFITLLGLLLTAKSFAQQQRSDTVIAERSKVDSMPVYKDSGTAIHIPTRKDQGTAIDIPTHRVPETVKNSLHIPLPLTISPDVLEQLRKSSQDSTKKTDKPGPNEP